MILDMNGFIFEYPVDDKFDEYPIKIFTSNKGTFTSLKVSIKRNLENTNLIPNNEQSNTTLKARIRSELGSIIKFAARTKSHNCSIVTHFSYYNTDMYVSVNINYPWPLSNI